MLQQFDVVGVSPRGTSQHMCSQCFDQVDQWEKVIEDLPRLPLRSVQEEKIYNDKIAQLAWACSGPNNLIAQHASTANTARDMEVIRRAMDDEPLNFYGFGYGAELGQTYADMYPERVRTVVVDNGVNSDHWYGQQGTDYQGLVYRIGTPEASKMTLVSALFACGKDCLTLDGNYEALDTYFFGAGEPT